MLFLINLIFIYHSTFMIAMALGKKCNFYPFTHKNIHNSTLMSLKKYTVAVT